MQTPPVNQLPRPEDLQRQKLELLERVTLAAPSERLRAQTLDSFFAVLPFVAVSLVLGVAERLGGAVILVGVLTTLAYILFADGLRGGQSLGKRLFGTAVVDASSGKPCTYLQSFVRNLPLAFLGVLDWALIFGSSRQRLGDHLANTIVVKKG